MRVYGFPVAHAVVGLIHGPIAEEQLLRTLAISQGDPMALLTSPFAGIVYTLLVVFLVLGVWLKRLQAKVEEEIVHVLEQEPADREGTTRS